jgi:CheY-like chemotaxis protein
MDNAKGNLSPEQVEFAESIYSSGNDLLNIINDILDLSKVEAGKLDIRIEDVIIPKMINEMKVSFQHLAREKSIEFKIQLDSDLPNSMVSDKQRLDQILRNLLSNAFKFTSAGSIQLRLYKANGDKIAFEVRDTGIGIPKDKQEIIFEAFKQADGNTTRKYGGSGLGLSISKDLARLLGGTLQVESSPGQGSTFTLIIPEILKDESAPTPARAYSHNASIVPAHKVDLPLPYTDDRLNSKNSPHLILVIEEEPKFSKILFDLVHELKFTCIVAQGADEGYQMAQHFNPEAILLDMNLPDHSGLTVMERLKESAKTRHIPVHVISSEDFTEETLDLGTLGYVLRPVTRERIREIFTTLEEKLSQKIHRVLIVEDDKIQRESISHLIADEGIETTMVGLATEALAELKNTVFDCMIMDLGLPGMNGYELLEKLAKEDTYSFPPVIVYTGSDLSREEEDKLRKYSKSIIIKGSRSSERLLDEVTLFLHKVEENLSTKRRQMLKQAQSREQLFEGRKILLVDDDVRNIFALSSVLEQRGAIIIVGRNGQEALNQLEKDPDIDLVLMDIMMPEMDGYEATRRIRAQKRFSKLPIIAVTAKAMLDDQEKCLEAGTNDFLAKPVDVDKLLSLMRVWMPKLGRFHA